MRKITSLILIALGLGACSSGSSNSRAPDTPPTNPPTNIVPDGFKCLPSITNNQSTKIAYGSNCYVDGSPQQAELQKMAVALMYEKNLSGHYERFCTGTPIKQNQDGSYYVLTAAHCVVGSNKAANQEITPNNIKTFTASNEPKYIYQGPVGAVSQFADLYGEITAVYVWQDYCKQAAFNNQQCSKLELQNGDIAVVRVSPLNSKTIALSNNLELAPANLSIDSPSYLLALGYGKNNIQANDTTLFYINYEYFADNSYQYVSAPYNIMNGYAIDDKYYSIICSGDSGGGDFYWNTTTQTWQLIGVHSFGPTVCGTTAYWYSAAFDASANVRPFTGYIQNLINSDNGSRSCNTSAATTNGFICRDEENG